jgi:hypothetical protein
VVLEDCEDNELEEQAVRAILIIACLSYVIKPSGLMVKLPTFDRVAKG